jgi:hypothetical protein
VIIGSAWKYSVFPTSNCQAGISIKNLTAKGDNSCAVFHAERVLRDCLLLPTSFYGFDIKELAWSAYQKPPMAQ